ncbi:uncharacterized protein [Halyomorpha halys]|uniref:uncharacterized protein n=1 Tax=Halyomorpha halys TaxID=286706 RepID=UPI0006D4F427|nr:uncharacterized protein LOC106679700 [Halyomorpha halys]
MKTGSSAITLIEKVPSIMNQNKLYRNLSCIRKVIMLSIWWEYKSVLYFALVPSNPTINLDVCWQPLMKIEETIKKKMSELANRNGSTMAMMNSSMQKGISALKEAVQGIDSEIERLCQYIPKAESIVTNNDDGKICALPGDINALHDAVNDIQEKRLEYSQKRKENDDIIDASHEELCSMYHNILENAI